VLDTLPAEVLDLGVPVGGLAEGLAGELGLNAGTPVAQGGADAFVAQIGLGVVRPGKLAPGRSRPARCSSG
jgi:ribulose kinase